MELTACIGWVNLLPEQIQQFLIGEDLRIVSDLNGFIMTRGIGADLLIRWILHVSASITGDHVQYSRQLLER
ncbi:hypothetical protein D3C85_1488330 [compost metagenome]